MSTPTVRDNPSKDELRLHLMTGLPDVSLVYQAIVDLSCGTPAGYEVLARFPSIPAASPDRWIAAAGEVGLGRQIETAIWQAAFEARDRLPARAFLSVNASPDFLASSECAAVLSNRGSLDGIVIEVTEHEAITDYDRLSATLSRYRSRGAAVAVDDAGAGYASMSHILALRPEFIKLDRAIVTDCDRDAAKAALVEMIDSFAVRTGSQLVAEGVETEGELATLTRMGVPLGQGYLLASPQADFSGPILASTLLVPNTLSGIAQPSVRSCVEPAVTAASEEQAFRHLDRDRRLDVVVVSQEPRGSLGIVLRRGDSTVRRPSTMCAHAGSEASDILLRAMTRDAAMRFDPIVCTENDGSILGILRIEHLIRHLAKHGSRGGSAG